MKYTRITFRVPLGDSVEMEVDVCCRMESGDVWEPHQVMDCKLLYTGQSKMTWGWHQNTAEFLTLLDTDVRLELVAYLADSDVGMGMFQRACADAFATPANYGGIV